MVRPVAVAIHLVDGVEPLALHEAVRKAQGYRRVVCPLASLKIEGTTACHVGDRHKGTARHEFNRSADCITASETEQAAEVSIFFRDQQGVRPLVFSVS
jgi:hypothetical protein